MQSELCGSRAGAVGHKRLLIEAESEPGSQAGMSLRGARAEPWDLFLRVGDLCWLHNGCPKSWKDLQLAFQQGVNRSRAPSCTDTVPKADNTSGLHIGPSALAGCALSTITSCCTPESPRTLQCCQSAGIRGSNLPNVQQADFYMCHPQHRVFYNNFEIEHVPHGALLECRSKVYVRAAQIHGGTDPITHPARPAIARSAPVSSENVQLWREELRSYAQSLVASRDYWSLCELSLGSSIHPNMHAQPDVEGLWPCNK